MTELFEATTEFTVLLINVMALLVVAIGTVEAFGRGVILMFGVPGNGAKFRAVYLRYARHLVGALTFQLAADILDTATSPSWDDIGRLAAIAVIRTFLNFFLERDLTEVREIDMGTAHEDVRPSRAEGVGT